MTTIIVNIVNNETLWAGEMEESEVNEFLELGTITCWDSLEGKYTPYVKLDMMFITHRKIEVFYRGLFRIIYVYEDCAGNYNKACVARDMLTHVHIHETIENYYTVQRVLTPEKRAWLAQMKEKETQ